MAFIMNLIMVSLLAGSAFCVILSIMAFLRVESLRITPNNNVKSGINLLITSLLFIILFVYSSWMQSYQNKSFKEPLKKMSVNRKITSISKSRDRLDLDNISLNIENEKEDKINEVEKILNRKRKPNHKSSNKLMMISSPTDKRSYIDKEYFPENNVTHIIKPEINLSTIKDNDRSNLGKTL